MPWIVALRESESKRVVIFDTSMEIAGGDTCYENDVHVIPCMKEENGMCVFGRHDVTLKCFCRPSVGPMVHGRYMVMHNEMVN